MSIFIARRLEFVKHQVTLLKEAKKELPILAAKAYNICRLKSAKENLCGYSDIKMTILC
jgi:hypothetical protein